MNGWGLVMVLIVVMFAFYAAADVGKARAKYTHDVKMQELLLERSKEETKRLELLGKVGEK
jgi:hypothetical protein